MFFKSAGNCASGSEIRHVVLVELGAKGNPQRNDLVANNN